MYQGLSPKKQQQQLTNEDEDVPPLMRVADDVQKSGQESFRELGDVEEEGDAADGVHDHDLGKHDADDPGGEAVVHHNPVNRWNDLEIEKRQKQMRHFADVIISTIL